MQGALRNAIATFVPISPAMKDKVWSLLEQYDLAVVATPLLSNGSMQPLPSQVRLSDPLTTSTQKKNLVEEVRLVALLWQSQRSVS
jgi:nuclear pore complex protein Nup205